MRNKVKIALLGGDYRHRTAACRLSEKTWDVFVWGMDIVENDALHACHDYEEALAGAAAMILPLPTSPDGKTLNCPLDTENKKTPLLKLLDAADTNTAIIGGRLPRGFAEEATARGFSVFDYFEQEDFQVKNAYTTAEAAISIAMNSLTKELRGARVAITGYGRIAKQLAKLLLAIGARVTVAARKDSDLAWASLQGCETYRLNSASPENIKAALSHGYDVIYNTVPVWLFDRDFLKEVDKKTFLIDLASAPGGIDVCAAKEFGSNVLWAASLPGKYAPDSAGSLIASCVDRILYEEVRAT